MIEQTTFNELLQVARHTWARFILFYLEQVKLWSLKNLTGSAHMYTSVWCAEK